MVNFLTGQRYEPGKVPGKLDLPAGVYLLKTYNQAYQDMSGWLDTEKGNMAFSAEKILRLNQMRLTI